MKKFIINLAVIVGITAYCAITTDKPVRFSSLLLFFAFLCGLRFVYYAICVVKEKCEKEEQCERERWKRH